MPAPRSLFPRLSGAVMQFVQRYYLALLLFVVCAISQLEPLAGWMRYDRALIVQGEYWRWLTANFTHLGWSHYAMNMGALGLMWLMFSRRFNSGEWLFIIALASLAVSAGVQTLLPHMHWYVGLSGTLHGILLAGCWREWRYDRLFSTSVAALCVIKLAYELLIGPMPGSEATAGGHVIVEAHAFGAIGGLAAALLLELSPPWRRARFND